jgi:hypothetical protein
MVPPSELEVRTLTDALSVPQPPGRPAFKSASFRTLCETCNSQRLGQLYDPELKRFCDRVATWIRSTTDLGLTLPPSVRLPARPGATARAVIGHILAAESGVKPHAPLSDAPMLAAMRAYFLTAGASAHQDLELFFWPFPSTGHQLARAVGISRVLGEPLGPIVGDFLKFFPLAWWLVFRRPSDIQITLSRMPLFPAEGEVAVLLRPVPPPTWPEEPMHDEVLVLNATRTFLSSDQRAFRPQLMRKVARAAAVQVVPRHPGRQMTTRS